MELPPPDPKRLLDEWMEWERGEATPGRVMANLKTAGLRDVLEALAAQAEAINVDRPATVDQAEGAASEESPAWTPTV